MKLIVCVFLIVVILEEYHCAPYFGTTEWHRHHHHLGPSRSFSSNRCRHYCSLYNNRFGHGTQYYHRMYDLPYGSRYRSRPCTWHGSRYCKGYGSYYGARPFIPHITPMHKPVGKTVEKPLTVVKSMIVDKPVSVAKLEEKPVTVDKSMIVNKSVAVEKLTTIKKTVEKSERKPVTEEKLVSIGDPVMVPLDKPVQKKPVDKPMNVPNLTEMPVNGPQDMAKDDSVDRTVYSSVDKPIDKSIDKPSGNVSEKPLDIPSIKSALENLSHYATVNPFDDFPNENLLGVATENSFIVTNISP